MNIGEVLAFHEGNDCSVRFFWCSSFIGVELFVFLSVYDYGGLIYPFCFVLWE